MTTKWYHYKLGKTRGPFSSSNIKLQITTNQIAQDDLIYKSDLNKWVKVKDLDEFQKLNSLQNISELNKMLVVLKHDTHKQLGPFDIDTVIEKVHGGEIEFCDYIWKKGMKSWKQIASYIKPVTKKQEHKEPKTETEDLGSLSKEEMLTSVVKLYELNNIPENVENFDMARQFGSPKVSETKNEYPANEEEQANEPDDTIRLLDDENTLTTSNKAGFHFTEFLKNSFLSICKFSKRYL